MPRKALLLFVVALFVITVGCSQTPTPAPAPPDTHAADVKAVEDMQAAWAKDANTKDADKWASYFTEDGSGLYPGTPTLHGKAAIKAAMAPYFSDPNFTVNFGPTRTVASKGGDMVYSEGTYTMTTINPKTKKPVTDKGKYLTVFMKQPDGSWKAVSDTFNSDSSM